MAKKQTSVRKREREVLKRQRAMAKVRKAAEKRELKFNKRKDAASEPPQSTGPGTESKPRL